MDVGPKINQDSRHLKSDSGVICVFLFKDLSNRMHTVPLKVKFGLQIPIQRVMVIINELHRS